MSDCSVSAMKPKARPLLPCPFCHGDAILRVDLNGMAFAKCRGCGATSARFRDGGDEARRRWNARYGEDDLR